jgi:hypothetical protein
MTADSWPFMCAMFVPLPEYYEDNVTFMDDGQMYCSITENWSDGNKTLTWYSQYSGHQQLNDDGYVYRYLAG